MGGRFEGAYVEMWGSFMRFRRNARASFTVEGLEMRNMPI